EFDAQAELLPGDEQRMSALVAGALQELERTEPTQAMRGGRRPRRRSDAWFFATSVGFGMLLTVALASAWQYAAGRHGSSEAAVAPSTAVAVARPSKPTPALAATPIAAPEPAAPTQIDPTPSAPPRSAASVAHVSTKPF